MSPVGAMEIMALCSSVQTACSCYWKDGCYQRFTQGIPPLFFIYKYCNEKEDNMQNLEYHVNFYERGVVCV